MPVLECPICHKQVEYAQIDEVPYRPFCCNRCKLIDLDRWFSGEYRIVEELPDRPPGTPPDSDPED